MAQAQQSSGTVTVGCKHPNGLHLRTFVMREIEEQQQGGNVRKTKRAEMAEVFTIAGPSRPHNRDTTKQIHDGYALTPGVPAALWNTWLEQNKDSDLVKNGIIFAHGATNDARSEATEKAKVKTGLERIDPKAIPKNLRVEPAKAKDD